MTENQGGFMIDLGRREFLRKAASGLLIPTLAGPAAKVFDMGRARIVRPPPWTLDFIANEHGPPMRLCRSVASGLWSDAATWEGGLVPQDGDLVFIAGHDVMVDGPHRRRYCWTMNGDPIPSRRAIMVHCGSALSAWRNGR